MLRTGFGRPATPSRWGAAENVFDPEVSTTYTTGGGYRTRKFATMDVSSISTPHDSASNPLGRALTVQHERVRDFLAAQRERVERIEAELGERIQACQEQLRQQQADLAERETTLTGAEAALRERLQEAELQQRRQQLEAEELNALRDSLAQRKAELDALAEEIESRRRHTESQRRRIARELRAQQQAQRMELNRRRSELEQAAVDRPAPPAPSQPEPTRMAVPVAAPASSNGRMSWEAEKQRLLAALEQEENGGGATNSARHVEIDEVIRATDRALADKDRELHEMRQILDAQSSNLGQVAVGAAALGDLLDRDALIREERENLKRLQAAWEEKLRQAEIDISLERAKLARQRAELEEKSQAYEHNREGAEPPGPTGPAAPAGKPARGRWLARLGLKDDKEGEANG